MPTRRMVLALLGAAALQPMGAPSARADSSGDVAFIRQLGDTLTGIINGPGSLAAKREKILPLIDQNVDVNGIARFCLGRYWRTASADQQARFLTLFHRVLANAITNRLGQYEGVKISVGGGTAHGDGTAVSTTVVRPGQQPADVQWVVDHVSGAPKVSDIIGEGVSLSITQRGDYTSYLQRNGNDVGALLKAMERQAARQA